MPCRLAAKLRATNSMSSSAAVAAASARLLTLNGWRTRFMMSATDGCAKRIADAQARQAVGLGKGARHDQVRMALEPFHRLGLQFRRQVLVVGLVDHHQHALGHALEERFQRLGAAAWCRSDCSGWRSRPRRSRRRSPRGHRVEVVAVVLRRHRDAARAARLRGERIDREAVLRVDRGAPRAEEGVRHEFEHVVRAVAENDRTHLHAIAARQSAVFRSWPLPSG